MPTRYWLKSISNEAGERVDARWTERHPWLLELVGSTRKMDEIRKDDLVILYAKGHQKIVGVARVSEPGGAALDPERVARTGAVHALSVQVRLAIPRITDRAPSYEAITDLTAGRIQGGRPVELSETEFLAGVRAIATSALPDCLDLYDAA